MSDQIHRTGVQRRTSMPQELEDPDDLTVSDPDVEKYQVLQLEASTSPTTATAAAEHGDDSGDGGGVAAVVVSVSTETVSAVAPLSPLQNRLLLLPKEVRNIIAGGIAGMVAKSVVAPLDRIKILYQVTPAEFKIRNIPRVTRNIIVNEGWTALWKGNIATLLRVFPYAGVQFMVFDRIKMWYLNQHDQEISSTGSSSRNRRDAGAESNSHKFGLTPTESLVAGMIAGTVSVICTYPLDLTRAQLAVLRKHKHHHLLPNEPKTKGFVRVLLDNHRRSGFLGLFRGMPVTLFGILPYSGIAFSLNEQGKREIQHMTGRDVTTVERLQCGAVAGLFAQTLTYPVEVTRRRMQTLGLVGNDTAFGNVVGVAAVRDSNRAAAESAPTYGHRPPNLSQTVRLLYAEQGIRGFFKGVSVNWAKGPIAFSISFTMFDTVQHFLETPAERALRLPRRATTAL